MLSFIRRRASFVNVVAVFVLIFAMAGGAYAAKKYVITSTSQIKPSVLKSLQGKAGPAGTAGPQGPQGLPGPAGTGAAGKDGTNGTNGTNGAPGAKGETGPTGKRGEEGFAGPTGPKGTTGTTGTTGTAGVTGPTGPEGVCAKADCTLPSGATETGTWNITQYNIPKEVEKAFVPISFPIPLAAPGNAFYFNELETEEIDEGTKVGAGGCKGTLEAPTAPKGTLCVYTASEERSEIAFTNFLAFGYGKAGTLMFYKSTAGTAELVEHGVWAVTAP